MPAFEVFFREHEKGVFRNAYLITGSKEDAEDVLQDVFTSVWKSRHTFDPSKGKVSTWLHRITVNQCFRKLHKDRPAMIRVDPEDIRKSASDSEDHGGPDLESLAEAMAALDGRHRAVLVLRYFDDLPYDEIAKALGIPLGTVKSRINHALKALRTRLGERRGID